MNTIEVQNDELQKAIEYMNDVLKKSATPNEDCPENGGQKETVSLESLAKAIGQLVKSLESEQEFKKACEKRLEDLEKCIKGEGGEPAHEEDIQEDDDEEGEEELEKCDKVKKGENYSELTELIKSMSAKIDSLEGEMNKGIRRSARGLNTFSKSNSTESAKEEKRLSKSEISSALLKVYEETGDEDYAKAVTTVELGGTLSPSIAKELTKRGIL